MFLMGNKTHIENEPLIPLSDSQAASFRASSEETKQNVFPLSSDLPLHCIDPEVDQDSRPTLPPISSRDLVISSSIDMDLTNPSMSTSLLAIRERHALSLSRRKKSLLAIAMLFLFAVPIAVSIWFLTISERPNLPNSPLDTIKTSLASPVVNRPNFEAFPLETTTPEIVQIQFTNLPQDVVVHFNQKPVATPIQIQKSSIPQFVEVKRNGENLFSTSLIPAKNLFIEIPLTKAQMIKHQNVKKRKANISRTSPKDTRLKTSLKPHRGSLSSNPFPLKNNPFANGE